MLGLVGGSGKGWEQITHEDKRNDPKDNFLWVSPLLFISLIVEELLAMLRSVLSFPYSWPLGPVQGLS